MDEIGRLIKPIVVAIVMGCSLFSITHNMGVSIVGMLIPLVLGWINIGVGLAYSLTALTFVVAVSLALTPQWVKRNAELVMNEVVNEARGIFEQIPAKAAIVQTPDRDQMHGI